MNFPGLEYDSLTQDCTHFRSYSSILKMLVNFLGPIAKTWPRETCLLLDSIAIIFAFEISTLHEPRELSIDSLTSSVDY